MIGIYKITNQVNGKIYIGQSANIQQRWKQHKNEAKQHRHNYALYNAMNKYGIDNFTFEILEECNQDSLNDREVYWIKYYDSFNKEKGYNLTPGGNEPIRANPQEIYNLWDQGLSISEIEKLVNIKKTQIKNYLNDYEDYSVKESNKRGGKLAHKTAVENGNYHTTSNKKYDKIKQYSLYGEYIAEFDTCTQIEEQLGISSDLIRRVLNGKQQQAGGYQWKIDDEPAKNIINKIPLRFGIIQYDLEGNEIKRYQSVKAAAIAMNCDPNNISRVCKHLKYRKTACGYKWEYDYSTWTD